MKVERKASSPTRAPRRERTSAPTTARLHAPGAEVEAKTKIAQVYAVLEAVYGVKQNQPSGDPLDGLIETILSQSTSDVNSHRAHQALRAAFPGWHAVLAAPDAVLADAIRGGGLANLKARRIKDALAAILAERGNFDLGFLAVLPLDEARAWLTSLPGVGPKTAACVLLFDLGRPALPVDTHVHRVAGRLGLIGPRVSAEAAHTVLQAQLRPEQVYEFHLNMIAHGRAICHALNPECAICPLNTLCDYYRGGQSGRQVVGQ
ncbi:MAG: endonuclease III domain-containing protein [Thermomicrobiales bacterium]